ncbi:WD repeat-containing protein, partial [Reticulomyxa filosa]
INIIFMLDTFLSSSKLFNTFIGHIDRVWSIDYSTFDDNQYICSGSKDNTIRIWDVNNNKQIQLFNDHFSLVYYVKFSQYHYHNNHSYVIYFSSDDRIIHFLDIKHNQKLQSFNGHSNCVYGIEFSLFNNDRYLCSGSCDNTIRLWDVETSKSLHIFEGTYKTKLIAFKGHEDIVKNVKYRSNELRNTILSGSNDKSIRLWDIQSGQQIQVFNGHTDYVNSIDYSPFIVKNIEISDNSKVICSGSADNTIRDKKGNGITCLKFILLNKKEKTKDNYGVNLYYCSYKGPIHVWGMNLYK